MKNPTNTRPLPAKLLPPNVKGALPRERLFGVLDSIRQSHRMIWLHAPPGAGKTTLAAGYAQRFSIPPLWYRFDEGDRDPAAFFHNFLDAAGACFDPVRMPPVFGPGYLAELKAYARQFFRTLLHHDGSPRLIVFDDYQSVESAEYLGGVLSVLCDEAPSDYSIMLLSRCEPPPELTRSAYAKLMILPAHELAFDKDETKALIAQTKETIDETELAVLLAECGGWPAALTIALHGKRTAGVSRRLLHGLAQTAWQGLPETDQRYLLELALPRTVDAELSERLTGTRNALNTLERLAEDRYLVSRSESAADFKIHPLLRDYLIDYLLNLHGESGLQQKKTETARILEEAGRIEEAAELYTQACAYLELHRLILEQASTELQAGRCVRLLNWCRDLPEIERADPWLSYWQAAATLPTDPKGAQQLFEQAHAESAVRLRSPQSDDPLGRLMTAAGVLTAMFFAWDDYSGAPSWFDELANLDDLTESLDDPGIDAWVLGCGNVLVHLDCHSDLLKKWRERAERRLPAAPPQSLLTLAGFLLQYHVWRGDIPSCRALLSRLQTLPVQSEPLFRITLLIWTAGSEFLATDHEAAYHAVEEARSLAETFGLRFLLTQIHGQEAYTALSCSDAERAASAINKMTESLMPGRRQDQGFVMHVRSGLSLLRGEIERARCEAEAAVEHCRTTGVHSSRALTEHGLAQILIRQGKWPMAQTSLDWVESYCLKNDRPLIRFMAQLTRADGLLSIGDEDGAVRILSEALAAGAEQGYLNPHPFWQPEVMVRLCILALERDIQADYVRRIIAKRELQPNAEAGENWPWPVKIRTLGGFRIDAAGIHLTLQGKKDNKPLRLLQMLIAINPDGVSAHYLTDCLWPENEADTALHAFEVNLQRLRKMLGRTDALVLQNGTLYLNRKICWLDIFTVDALLRRLDSDDHESVDLACHLLQIWRGDFMIGIDNIHVLTMREIMASKFLRAIESLGQKLEASGAIDKAVDCYRRAIETMPLSENLHARLIETFYRQGKKSEAWLAYRRFETLYIAHFGNGLSATMTEWREILRPLDDHNRPDDGKK